ICQHTVENPNLPIKVGCLVLGSLLLGGKVRLSSPLRLFSSAPLSISSLRSLQPLPLRLTPNFWPPATLPSSTCLHHLHMTTSNDEGQAWDVSLLVSSWRPRSMTSCLEDAAQLSEIVAHLRK